MTNVRRFVTRICHSLFFVPRVTCSMSLDGAELTCSHIYPRKEAVPFNYNNMRKGIAWIRKTREREVP